MFVSAITATAAISTDAVLNLCGNRVRQFKYTRDQQAEIDEMALHVLEMLSNQGNAVRAVLSNVRWSGIIFRRFAEHAMRRQHIFIYLFVPPW